MVYSRYQKSLIAGTKPVDWRYRERLLFNCAAGKNPFGERSEPNRCVPEPGLLGFLESL